MDIVVEEVKRFDGVAKSARIRVGGVVFQFCLQSSGRLTYTKSKPESQVHDPSSCWVPDKVFRDVYKRAAAILKCQSSKKGG